MAAWKATVSGSSCVRRRSSTGVRSAPPPNQGFVVTTKRVFMCTVGTFGFQGWAMSEMPPAQKRGSWSEPGIWPRNSGANSPCTVETCTPTFSNTRPRIIDMTPPPPGAPLWSLRSHGLRSKRPGSDASGGRGAVTSSSSASKAAQIRSRRSANQMGASVCRRSTAAWSVMRLVSGFRKDRDGERRPVCRRASPRIMAAVTATLRERMPGLHGNDDPGIGRLRGPRPARRRIPGRPG